MLLHKSFEFESAHKIENYDGKCKHMHGHNWKVDVILSIKLNEGVKSKEFNGILIDFNEIKRIKKLFDHKDLNKVITINPTSENLASVICLLIKDKLKERFKKLNKDFESCFDYIEILLSENNSCSVKINDKDAVLWLNIDLEGIYSIIND